MERRTNNIDSKRENLCNRTFGDYRIERRIGGGATSDVFLATQISLGRRVALKILKDELANDESYVKRFIQEARAAARLEHPNIVRIYEVGETTPTDSEVKRCFWRKSRSRSSVKTYRFIAQEYVDGISLAQYLRKNRQVTILQTFAALEQIVAALKRASDLNIVHRDVKPENVLIDSSGVLKVVDFGLARIIDADDSSTWVESSLTRTGIALGTPLYMSPEQARGQKIDSRSDVYALGVTAYRLLTGVVPFSADTPLAVVLKHLNEQARPISELRPDAPEALTRLIRRMMEKNPNDRPNSINELSEELRQARREYVATLGTTNFISDTLVGARTVALDADASKNDGLVLKSADVLTTSPLPNSNELWEDGTERGFFQSDEERGAFRRFIDTTNLSGEWQTNCAKLEETLRGVDEPFWNRRRARLAVASAFGAALLGGGVLLLKNNLVASALPEPPLAIKRFESVEEQYVFALQLGTVDAWKSVCEYFPDDAYWNMRAKKQLALIYVEEKDVESASAIFQEIASNPTPGKGVEPFGLVGLAWRAASLGDDKTAAAMLSELDETKRYDGLTEFVIRKTRTLIHRRMNPSGMQGAPPFAWPPAEFGGNKRSFLNVPDLRQDFRPKANGGYGRQGGARGGERVGRRLDERNFQGNSNKNLRVSDSKKREETAISNSKRDGGR